MNEFEKLFSLIHEGKRPNIEYSKFKDMLSNYIESLMKGIVLGKANYVCGIKPLDKGHHGAEGYDENSNTYVVIISENITQSIYNGTNPFNIFTIFHELSHVFDEYNIKNRDFHDANLKKICIEMGLRRATALGDLFYKDNYKSVAIEAHANLLGSQLIRDFYEKCNIALNNVEEQGLLFLEFFALRELNNPRRSYEFLFDGSQYNDYKLPLSKIVEEIKNNHPEFYNNLRRIVGEENLVLVDEDNESEFETRVYAEHAILELSDIIYNPLFTDLVEAKTEYRPRV